MRSDRLPRHLTVLLILLAFGLALTSAARKSPTMDEQNHIARGAAYLGTGDPRLSVEHPPLVNLLSALPVHLLLHPRLPVDTLWWEAGEWYHFAALFLWEYNPSPERIVFLARLPVIGLGMLLAALVFRWGRTLFGAWGGLVAAAFCALDPNILAHERLSTTDLGGTAFVFLAAYALWRAVRRPSRGRVVVSGVALGLAFGAKLSALLFGPILVLTAGVYVCGGRWATGGSRRLGRDDAPACPVRTLLASAAVITLTSLLTVWALYRFQVGPPDGGGLSLPAPPYVRGIEAVLGFAAGGRPGYLLGRVSTAGWWYYFPVAFAVKTPTATLAGLLLATVALVRRRSRDDLFVLLPPLLYFLVSTTARLNLGYRHLLPILPFLALHIARLAARPFPRLTRCLAAFPLVAALFIYPNYLAYFNLIGGGPDNGWHILVDSNLDWGQDMKGLRAWMEREQVARVRLSWFGTARPEVYGISCDLLPGVPYGFTLWEDPPFDREQPEPGVYVISVTNLVGVVFPDHDLFAWFRARPPDDKIGYSLFVYRVP